MDTPTRGTRGPAGRRDSRFARRGTTNPSPSVGVSILLFWYFLVTAVPCRSGVLADAQHLPHGRCGQGTATSTSTRPGTTSRQPVRRPVGGGGLLVDLRAPQRAGAGGAVRLRAGLLH